MGRARSSDLYQVDFVAALFSGFLLIWLARASDSDIQLDAGPSPVFYSVEARLYYEHEGRTTWLSLLPDAAVRETCVPRELVALIAASESGLVTCYVATPPTLLSKVEGPSVSYMRSAIATMSGKVPINRNVIPVFGVRVSAPPDSGSAQFNFLGLALKVLGAEKSDYSWEVDSRDVDIANAADRDLVYVAVGVLSRRDDLPRAISATKAHEFTSAIYSARTTSFPVSPDGEVRLVSNMFRDINTALNLTTRREKPSFLKVIINLDPSGQSECYSATLYAPFGENQTAELKSC